MAGEGEYIAVGKTAADGSLDTDAWTRAGAKPLSGKDPDRLPSLPADA
jgi:hypothetical protein